MGLLGHKFPLEEMDFYKGDLGGIWEALRPVRQGDAEDAVKWNIIALPHCFNSTDAVNPDETYYRGAGWYRTNLDLNNPYKNGKTILHFEGAGQKCQVYIGDEQIGSHEGGYDEWQLDITEYGKCESPLPLTIRCDNFRDLESIPSDLSDFNLYGGLFRPVNVIYQPVCYLSEITLKPHLTEDLDKGNLIIDWCLQGLSKDLSIEMDIKLFNPENEIIISLSETPVSQSSSTEFVLDNPMLWDPDHPNLYNLEITLLIKDSENDLSRITYYEHFGWRHFQFMKKGPFYLNGKRVLLKGTHRHEDHAGTAAAMTFDQIDREMRMIKDMGANFIRLGHYQQSTQVLDLCDELGILVWEEIPWCRGGLGGSEYRDMGMRMLESMIIQHYNHPSIIIWGLGNENDWPGDFDHFEEEEIRDYMSELNDFSHKLDPMRKTAIRRCEFCKDIPDVYSPSIWAGWYRGSYREYRDSTMKHIDEVDHFLHVEWGADSHGGRFNENPYDSLEDLVTGTGTDERAGEASFYGGIARASRDGDWSENYACDLFDWTLKEQLTMKELTGTAFWPFKDFSTPLRPENPIPYVNQKGVVQRDLTPKESFYVVQSYWGKEPMIRLFGHDWQIRWGDEGEVKEIKVYSNCSEVELFLDGASLGKRKRDPEDFPAAGLRWKAALKSGQHNLKAVAYSEGKNIEDHYDFYYHSGGWGAPAYLKNTFIKDADSRLFWQIQVTDDQGRPCLDCKERIGFTAAGPSPFIKDRGTEKGSSVIECANGRATIELKDSDKAAVLGATLEDLFCSAPFPPEGKL